jgi:AcrR family transcriptional regulator
MLTMSTCVVYPVFVARARPARPRKHPLVYHHGNLRRALLDEALTTIRDGGVESLTLRAVGARLGVSRSALYRHFADKRALVSAVGAEGFRLFRTQLTAAWERAGRGRAGFEAMGIAYVQFAVTNPSHYRVMFGGFLDPNGSDPDLLNEASRTFHVLVDSLAEQQRDGLVRQGDPRQLARFVWAVVHGVATLAIDGQLETMKASPDELARFAVEQLRTGIARRAHSTGPA